MKSLGGPIVGACLLALCGCAQPVQAATLTLTPSADTSLIEIAPTNNNGGQAWLLSGKIQNAGFRDRALMKFDLSALPPGAVVQAVTLTLEVTRRPGDGFTTASFGLHRMLRPWGEGNNVAITNPGQGLPATPGEATWTHAFFPTNEWSVPGGAPDVDFSAVESSFQFIYGLNQSPYQFESTPELVADVQSWVSDPNSNFGWMLLCDDEITPFTARRFGSREDPNAAPLLEISYEVSTPAVRLLIDRVQKIGNKFQFGFLALPGQSYSVEHCDDLAVGDWRMLVDAGTYTSTNRVLVVDLYPGAQRFYRVAAH